MPDPETFHREQLNHARESRDLCQFLRGIETQPQCILNALDCCARIGWSFGRAFPGRLMARTPGGLSRLSNPHHMSGHLRIESTPTSDASATADLGEIFPDVCHERT
jgi:hypothetical protein